MQNKNFKSIICVQKTIKCKTPWDEELLIFYNNLLIWDTWKRWWESVFYLKMRATMSNLTLEKICLSNIWKIVLLSCFICETICHVIVISNNCFCQRLLPAIFQNECFLLSLSLSSLKVKLAIFASTRSGSVNPRAPVAQKIADEVVFRHCRGEGVEFFKIGPHWRTSFGNYRFKPFQISFFSGF